MKKGTAFFPFALLAVLAWGASCALAGAVPVDISSAAVMVEGGPFYYSGGEIKPDITVRLGGAILDPAGYTAGYSYNVEPGWASVSISGNGVTVLDGEGRDVTYIGGTDALFEVRKARLTVHFPGADPGLVYNGSVQEIVWSISGEASLGHAGAYIAYSGADMRPIRAGSYRATVHITNSNRYELPAGNTFDFSIAPKVLTVTALAGEKLLGAPDPSPVAAYTVSGQMEGETPVFAGELSRLAGEAPGLYGIEQGTLRLDPAQSVNSNYVCVFQEGTPFTIREPEAAPAQAPPTDASQQEAGGTETSQKAWDSSLVVVQEDVREEDEGNVPPLNGSAVILQFDPETGEGWALNGSKLMHFGTAGDAFACDAVFSLEEAFGAPPVVLSSADGGMMLLAGFDEAAGRAEGPLQLLDTRARKIAALAGSKGATAFDISADGTKVAFALSGRVQVLNLQSGVTETVDHDASALTFIQDGRLALGVEGTNLLLLSENGQVVFEAYEGPADAAPRMNTARRTGMPAFSEDGKEIVYDHGN